MADGNQIGAKIVLTGEDQGASAAVKKVADEAKALTATTDAARDASGRFTAGQQAAQGAVQASGSGIGALKGSIVELAGSLPGVGGALSGAIEGASGAFGQLSGVASAVASGPLAAVTASIGVVTAGLGLAEKALDSFANKQDRITGLDAALAQQGLLTDAYREKLQKLAGQLGAATGQGGAWVGVLQRLTQMGADASNIDAYAESVKGLAGLLGGDLDRAAMVWGRAMNGNFEVLRRYGIQVDKTKSQHEQLADAMQQVAARGGGQLEAQTHTLHGQMRALSGAVGGLFTGLGNLISQSGLVQAGMGALTTVLRGIGSILPKTVEEVEGLTNKLPPLKDAFGHVRDGADEFGEGLDGVASSSDEAGGGLDRAGAAAKKTTEQFEAATEAAKKLRQQQDAMADAQTALQIAQVDAAEAERKIKPEDANRRRAQIRADAEQEANKRKVAEQDAIIQAAIDKRYAAGRETSQTEQRRDGAETDFARAAQAAGVTPRAAEHAGEESERTGSDEFGAAAKLLRANAQRQRDKAAELASSGAEEEDSVTRQRREQAQAAAEQADKEAAAMEKLAAQYRVLRQARSDDATAQQKYAQAQADEKKTTSEAEAEQRRLQIERTTAALQANTQQQKLASDERKKAAENDEDARQTEIKRLDGLLKSPGLTDARRQQAVDARRGLESQSDAYTDAAAKNRGDTPEQIAQRQALRNAERAPRDAQDTGGGDAVVADARGVAGVLTPGAPGSLSAQAIALIQQIQKSAGKDTGQDHQLIAVLLALSQSISAQGGRDPALAAAVEKLKRDVDTLEARRKNKG